MSARDEMRKLAQTARAAEREAKAIQESYGVYAAAVEKMLEVCSDAKIEEVYERVKHEAPSLLPS